MTQINTQSTKKNTVKAEVKRNESQMLDFKQNRWYFETWKYLGKGRYRKLQLFE